MTTRLIATQVYQEDQGFGGWYTPCGWVDAAGNTWDAYSKIGFPPSDTFQAAAIVKKVSPTGAVLADWEIVCPTTGAGVHKADGVGIYPSGDRLIVTITGHSIDAWPRSMVLAKVAIPGFAPYQVGEMPAGKAGAFLPEEGNPQPGGTGVTKEEVIEAVREVLGIQEGTLVRAIAGSDDGQIRQGLEDKGKDSALELNDPANYATDERAKRFQDITFERDKQRMFYGLVKHIAGGKWNEAEQKWDIPNDSGLFDAHMKVLINEVLDEREA